MQQNHLPNLESLLVLIASSDQNAFRKLLKFYARQLNSYIMGFTRSQSLTEEIVQDVFLKIWLNRTTLTEIVSFKSYLFVTARNHTLDCLKQIKRKKKREKEWINTVINQASINAEESLLDKFYDRIEEAVKSLPNQQKKIYLLRNKGLKRIEIAEKLNISVETVKKHSMFTKRFLKKSLSKNIV